MMKLKGVVFIGVFIISVAACAQSSEKGWQNLFNGKDLTGWKRLGGTADYKVEDGDEVKIHFFIMIHKTRDMGRLVPVGKTHHANSYPIVGTYDPVVTAGTKGRST